MELQNSFFVGILLSPTFSIFPLPIIFLPVCCFLFYGFSVLFFYFFFVFFLFIYSLIYICIFGCSSKVIVFLYLHIPDWTEAPSQKLLFSIALHERNSLYIFSQPVISIQTQRNVFSRIAHSESPHNNVSSTFGARIL